MTGTPAVLIPLPGAPGDHQTENARALERVGAAELVPDAAFDGSYLASVIDRLAGDDERLDRMRAAAAGAGRPDAAARVADIVESFGGPA